MIQAAAQNAVLLASSLVGREVPSAEGVVDGLIVTHVPCTVQSARTVGMKRKCLFSRERTDRCIVVSATNRSVPRGPTIDSAGKLYDRHCSESRRLV
jgi:hypothetical protein